MAERRMFAKTIINSARFLKMPSETQALYFHLGLHADDDGVVEAFSVMRSIGVSEDSLKILVAKDFVRVLNDDLVSYILDWNEHNKIRPDRKADSVYKDLLLQFVPDAHLIEKRPRADLKKINGRTMDGQWTDNGPHRIGKDRIGEVRLGKGSIVEDNSLSCKQDVVTEIIKYLNSKTNSNYHTSGVKTRKLINTRLKEGFTLDDFKTVIDKKVMLWGNNLKMSAYLRPETLFGTKFESYLNEIVSNSKAMSANGVVSEKTARTMDAMNKFLGDSND